MKTAPAPSLSEPSPPVAGSCQQEPAAFQERVRILEAIADRMPYTWYVYDVIANRCVWSGRHSAGLSDTLQTMTQAYPEQIAPGDLHPDDLDALADRRQRIAQIRDGEAIGTEYRVRVAGAWRHFYCRDRVLGRDENGAPRHVLSFIEDLSGRLGDAALALPANQDARSLVFQYLDGCANQPVSREICDKVLDSLPIGMALLDRTSGRLLWANRTYARQMGQTQPAPAGGLTGSAVQQFAASFEVLAASGETLPVQSWPIDRALAGEQFDDYQVLLRHRASGRMWPASFDSVPLSDPTRTQRLMLLLFHPPQRRGQPDNCAERRGRLNGGLAPDMFGQSNDPGLSPFNVAASGSEATRSCPKPDRPGMTGNRPLVYVAGPGDSLEAGC